MTEIFAMCLLFTRSLEVPQFGARIVNQLFGDATRLDNGARCGFARECGLVVGVLCEWVCEWMGEVVMVRCEG